MAREFSELRSKMSPESLARSERKSWQLTQDIPVAYPAKFSPGKQGFTVTFPDFPEAITSGYSEEEAMEMAVDALKTVISEYIKQGRDIPRPSRCPKGMRMVSTESSRA